MPTERAIIRRLRSLGNASPGYMMPPSPQEETDRRRFYLAEELLKIRAETVADGNLSAAASEALAAAEIIYPEPPPENGEAGAEVSNG